jgi:hypothetical protein
MNPDRYVAKIAVADLKHGAYYEGRCRNATVARWNADRQVFVHWRTKFNETFLEEIKHPEHDKHFDVFVVEKEIPEPAAAIPLK